MSSSGWDHMAEWWDTHLGEEGDLWHRALIDPPLLRLAGEVSGKRVLDLTCGNGYLSRRFAREARQGHRRGCECTADCACPEQRGTRAPRYSLSRGRCSPSLHARRWGVRSGHLSYGPDGYRAGRSRHAGGGSGAQASRPVGVEFASSLF
jgi:hypothetical protein